jgi:hypothetical protein
MKRRDHCQTKYWEFPYLNTEDKQVIISVKQEGKAG